MNRSTHTMRKRERELSREKTTTTEYEKKKNEPTLKQNRTKETCISKLSLDKMIA